MPDDDHAEPSSTSTGTVSTPRTTNDVPSPVSHAGLSEPEVDEFGLPIKKLRRRFETVDQPAESEQGKPPVVETPVAASEYNDLANLKDGPPSSQPSAALSGSDVLQAEHCPPGGPDTSVPKSVSPSNAPATGSRGQQEGQTAFIAELSDDPHSRVVSEWSHQQLAPQKHHGHGEEVQADHQWQAMPAYAPYDIYDDDNKLVAREAIESDEEDAAYGHLGGAGKGYTRVQIDEDAESATSMDENTAYLFKESGTHLQDEDDDARDPLSQMQATKSLLTEGQRIAYVGMVRLATMQMIKDTEKLERTRVAKKARDISIEAMKMWAQKVMVRLYSHMDIDSAEQMMIEQLDEHGVQPSDLTPTLMQNARVKNPIMDDGSSTKESISSPPPTPASKSVTESAKDGAVLKSPLASPLQSPQPQSHLYSESGASPTVRSPSQLPRTQNLDIDLRWTILCDLFLVLIADSIYDARSRSLLERVGLSLEVSWLEICRFEKRVTDALEIQEAANKENWNENEHMENRKKMSRNRRLAMMGLATVGGGLVIGLSAGLLAPVIGAGLAAGFTTIGVAGTSGFLAGAGGAAVITTTGVLTGGTIAVRASNRRTGAVRTFEYRPLHNNKRVNLIVTVAGWMNGKVDDVRLPYSTVDPVMGDIYSVFWEPEMLQSMGDTINILATEALTQGLQQVLGSTILIALMASLQLPIVLTKLSYLIDNPWTVSLARADAAGLILADSLIDRNLGVRPITLVGFSLGSRLIFSCLKELSSRGAHGLVQNVYLFGSPMVAKTDEYLKARSIVPGRFVNGYATNDWILGYLFRATSGGIMRVAGLAPVEVSGVENVNVTELVNGHMAYRAAMPRLLREVGWLVESDEFTEIEDPDPENHEKRQRELINEIEEARKELEKKPEKKKWGFLNRKKLAEKKEWETYDEKVTSGEKEAEGRESNVLFDIDAIRAEAAELAAQGIEIKQLESTLPPMRLDIPESTQRRPNTTLRETRSFNDSIHHSSQLNGARGDTEDSKTQTWEGLGEDQGHLGQKASLNVQSPYEPPSTTRLGNSHDSNRLSLISWSPQSASPGLADGKGSPPWESAERPPLRTASTTPATAPGNFNPEYNAWEDEDEFGVEKEVSMTFE